MKSIFLPVLDETTVDGVEITKEWIQKYAPTMEGKPVNIDHNYYSQIPIVVGTVDKVFFDTEGRLYAKITIGDNLAYKISDAMEGWEDNPEAVFKGVSFEWGMNENGEYEFKGLALCFRSIPKVNFAKLNHQLVVDTILASVKSVKNRCETMDSEKIAGIIKDVLKEELPNLVEHHVKEILASQKQEGNGEGNDNKDDDVKGIELLASTMNENNALLKTLIKNIEELRKETKEINASRPAGSPPHGDGAEDYSNGVVLDL
jgi:hypothetical protein